MQEQEDLALQLSILNKNSLKHLKPWTDSGYSIKDSLLALRNSIKLNLDLVNLDIVLGRNELQKHNIGFVFIWDSKYPELLKHCVDAPIVLFFVGNYSIVEQHNLLSIVGTRTMTSYGKLILEELIPSLQSFVVVSGMAFGVDAYAHKLSIDNNIKTIAVLPDSCDSPTPKGNVNLYKKILDTGNLIISDKPPGIASHVGLYARRNRIIAGLSMKTIVVEAGSKSGALITANLAFDYNREVFAFPGAINSFTSKGCNYLIKNNIAQLIESSSDFLGTINKDDKFLKLTEIERKIYYAILREPKTLSELSRILNLKIQILSSICTKLEINGILNTGNQNKYYVT